MTLRPILAAAGGCILSLAGPASAQLRPAQPSQPVQVQPLRQPTNAELMGRIEQLADQVAQLTDRIAALNAHVASLSGGIGAFRAQEQAHYVATVNAARAACGLLYLHHWQKGSASHAWRSSDYCEGLYSDNGLYNPVQ